MPEETVEETVVEVDEVEDDDLLDEEVVEETVEAEETDPLKLAVAKAAEDIANLKKALRNERTAHRNLKKAADAEKAAAAASGSATEIEKAQAAITAADAKAEKFRQIALKSAIESALTAQNSLLPTSRLMKLMDLNEIEIGDDGKIEGLEDQIDLLKEDFPEAFAVAVVEEKPVARRVGSVDAGKKPVAPKKLSTAQAMLRNAGM